MLKSDHLLLFFQPTALPRDVAGRWNLLTTFLYPALKSIGGFTFISDILYLWSRCLKAQSSIFSCFDNIVTFAPRIIFCSIGVTSPTLVFTMPHKRKQGLTSARNYAYSVVISFLGFKGS